MSDVPLMALSLLGLILLLCVMLTQLVIAPLVWLYSFHLPSFGTLPLYVELGIMLFGVAWLLQE